jgi:FtsP/CotA-like multicopper oxidase with cupredoxin domain
VLADMALPSPLEATPPPQTCPDLGGTPSKAGDPFAPVPEFTSKNGKLEVNMTVTSAYKRVAVVAQAGYQCRPMLVRYYLGHDVNSGAKWPTDPHLPGPGPTLRARVGDSVTIRLLNAIKPADFGKTTSSDFACNVVNAISPSMGSSTPLYPGTDTAPSCFHGDNITNLHYHGTHVSPDGHGDNVMIDVTPISQTTIPPGSYKGRFDNYFKITPPPSDQVLADQTKPYQMGQAPGTHWYHAHKHGSVALQLLNGMAGAFVIEGEFDDQLEVLIPGLRKTEKVLVIQQLGDKININAGPPINTALGGDPFPLVNGQVSPTITMRPGEIQRWRFINATMSQTAWMRYQFQPVTSGGAVPEIRQIAYDGIQLAPERYADPAFGQSQQFTLAPANRVDILIQAPPSGQAKLVFQPIHGAPTPPDPILVQVNVAGPVVNGMNFPSPTDYPAMPTWLKWDENDPRNAVRITRKLQFNSDNTGRPAINGKAFDGTLNQLIYLNTAEEWILENYWDSSIHPFHIHVNPFQVLEIYDPNAETQAVLQVPYNWADTITIPASKTVGTTITPGRVRIRSRYVDFTGTFVLHCHILEHEDRGMMQEVQIVDLAAPKLQHVMHH